MKDKKLVFDAKLIAKMGIFTALSFALTFLEFPIFPVAPFLKLDFSNVFVLIGGFSLGTIPGIIILVVKEALCLLKSSTVVGQLANVLIGLSYILVPLVLYRYKRSFITAIIGLAIGSVLMSGISLPVNRYINFPLYGAPDKVFVSLWIFVFLFNLIKSFSTAIITVLLYKRVKKLLSF